MSEKSVPEVRFREFIGEWDKKNLEAQVDFYSGLTYSPQNIVDDGGTLVLRSSNVKNGEVVDADNVYVDSSAVNCQNVRLGDIIVVVRNGSRALIGKHGQIKAEMQDTVIGAFMTGVQSKQPDFINALLDTVQFSKEIEKNLGATINQITTGSFKKMSFFFTEDTDEQTKIGEFFKNLDNLIAQNQKKYDKLVNMKKACLGKMFPKDGADTPEVRAKGFSGKWKTQYFYSLYEKVSLKNDLTYGTDKMISVANMYFKQIVYISDIRYLKTYNIFKIGDIAFEGNRSKDFANGRFVENTIGNGIISHVFDVFRPKNPTYDLYFWKYAINNESLMGKILIRCTKSSTMMTNLVASDFLKEYFLVPSSDEQTKIGTFFQTLDTLITLQKTKLEKLKNIKKACLDKMFI